MPAPLCILACTKSKATAPSPARSLYLGPYFQHTLRWALSVLPQDRIRVASAMYGLVKLDQVLDPYERKLGEGMLDSWSVKVAEQAAAEGLLRQDVRPVWILCPHLYTQGLWDVWPEAIAPLHECGGIFGVSATLAANRGRRPLDWRTMYRVTASGGTRALLTPESGWQFKTGASQ
jgi:hypothetical protein